MRHISGVYSTNAAGEVLPHLYIFKSRTQDEDNCKVVTCWCNGLLTFNSNYGLFRRKRLYIFVFARNLESIDTIQWEEFNKKVILSCYPNISKNIHEYRFTNRILSGLFNFKTDAGPGRLLKESKIMDLREKIHVRGLVIIFVLPNSTAATHEMDQSYSDLKLECDVSTQCIVGMKISERVQACKKLIIRKHGTNTIYSIRGE